MEDLNDNKRERVEIMDELMKMPYGIPIYKFGGDL